MSGPADAIIELYDRRAMDWDADRGRELFERPWLDRFLEAAPGPVVLDAGCGSGDPIARYLIGRGCAVTGVDAAPALTALCREKFPQGTWEVGDLHFLDLGRVFDGVIAWHSLIHLTPEDQAPALGALLRHVAPGGILMFTTGPRRSETVGEWRGEPLYHGSLDPADYRRLLEQAGFSLLDHALEDPNCGHATVWLARRKKAPAEAGA